MGLFVAFCLISIAMLANCSRVGIYELGEPLNSKYQGVLVCNSAITLNATPDITDSHLKAMFKDALQKREQHCE
jgi:hypothetical protein